MFIAGGVETVSRFGNGAADTGPPNEKFSDARGRSKARGEGGQGSWTPPSGLPDVYLAMGQTAENVREMVLAASGWRAIASMAAATARPSASAGPIAPKETGARLISPA